MPNRILRDWTDSEIVDKLSAKAEVFFARLIMKADDFGCYHANAKLLKSNLYPLRETMRPNDIPPLLHECVSAGLLITYTVAGKDYLSIHNFGQRLRQANRKFPEPPENTEKRHVSNSRSIDSNLRLETEVEVETEEETEKEPPQAAKVSNLEKALNDFLDMRKRIRKPATERAIELIKIELRKLAPGNANLQQQILEQSITNSWQDVYPLKDKSVKIPEPKTSLTVSV